MALAKWHASRASMLSFPLPRISNWILYLSMQRNVERMEIAINHLALYYWHIDGIVFGMLDISLINNYEIAFAWLKWILSSQRSPYYPLPKQKNQAWHKNTPWYSAKLITEHCIAFQLNTLISAMQYLITHTHTHNPCQTLTVWRSFRLIGGVLFYTIHIPTFIKPHTTRHWVWL